MFFLGGCSRMSKILLVIPVIMLLVGCPGRHVKKSEFQSVYIDGQRVCFTIDKQKILTRYAVKRNNPNYEFVLHGDDVQLSYPDSCFTASLEKGEVYNVDYTVDGKNYYYKFIIDNENHHLALWR